MSWTVVTFLSTPSGWKATIEVILKFSSTVFLSTPSGWKATKDLQDWVNAEIISIHALRVEGDLPAVYDQSLSYYISIHALRVEGD